MNRLTRLLVFSVLLGVGASALAQNYSKLLLVNGSNTIAVVPGTLSGNRIDTLADVGANARFIMSTSSGLQWIQGNLLLTGTVTLSGLTASLPLKLDASKNIISAKIDLTTDVNGVLPAANGGMGLSSLTANGVIAVNSAGTGFVQLTGSQYNILTVDGTGAPTFGQLDLSQSAAIVGVLPIVNGGTNSSTALNNGRVMVSSGGKIVELAASTIDGQFLQTTTAGVAPTWASVLNVANGGTGTSTLLSNAVLYGNGTGVVSNTGVSTAAGQFLQTTASGGAPTWKTVLDIANGGTNLSALGTANQVLGVNAGVTGLEYKTVTAGSGISVTQAAGSITIAATGGSSSYEEVNATAGALTIGGTKTVVTILDDGSGAIALSLPGSGTNGQMLTVYNDDADDTTGVIIGSKMAVTFVYTGGGTSGWRRIVP